MIKSNRFFYSLGFVVCLAMFSSTSFAGDDGTGVVIPTIKDGDVTAPVPPSSDVVLPSDGELPPIEETTPPPATNSGPQVNLDQCSQAFSEANECCNNPLACMGGGASAQDIASAVALIGAAASMGMGSMSADQKQSMQQACQIMQVVGTAAGAVNGGGAAICNQKKNSCLSACGQVRDTIQGSRKAMSDYCGQLTDTLRAQVPECNQSASPEQESDLNYANTRMHACETFSANVQAMGMQAAQSGSAASMGQLCSQLASSMTETPANVGDLDEFDCTDPRNQYDLRCRDCSDPKNKDNPVCKNTDLGDGGDNQNSLGSTASLGSSGSSFDVLDTGDGDASKQTPKFGDTGNQTASAKGVPSNGGGMPMGGSGGGGLGGGGSGGGAGGGGYNTDVLRGLGGGSGYSGNPGGGYVSSSGGFSGYGGGGNARARRSFDLKQFLPGGKKDPTRKIAGGDIHADIGPSHVDIWGRLSNRVKEICKLNRLYDCGK